MFIALIVVAIIFGYSLYRENFGNFSFTKGPVGYIFLATIFVLIISLIFFLLVSFKMKKSETKTATLIKKDKNDNSIIDFFYVDTKELKDLDEEYIQEVKKKERIVEYVDYEEEKKDYYDLAMEKEELDEDSQEIVVKNN